MAKTNSLNMLVRGIRTVAGVPCVCGRVLAPEDLTALAANQVFCRWCLEPHRDLFLFVTDHEGRPIRYRQEILTKTLFMDWDAGKAGNPYQRLRKDKSSDDRRSSRPKAGA